MIFTHIKWYLRYRSTQYPSRLSGIRGPGAVYPYWRYGYLQFTRTCPLASELSSSGHSLEVNSGVHFVFVIVMFGV